MAILHAATPNYDILARNARSTSVAATARFYRDTIVAGIERALLDEHVAARFRIAAIVVRPVTSQSDASNSHVLAKHRVQKPHRRIRECDPFNQHIIAVIELHKIRAKL